MQIGSASRWRKSAAVPKADQSQFLCHTPRVLSNAREARWRERLVPYYRDLGIGELTRKLAAEALERLRRLGVASPQV
jgi:hypothetical protein